MNQVIPCSICSKPYQPQQSTWSHIPGQNPGPVHRFHTACIASHIAKQLEPSCPICKEVIPAEWITGELQEQIEAIRSQNASRRLAATSSFGEAWKAIQTRPDLQARDRADEKKLALYKAAKAESVPDFEEQLTGMTDPLRTAVILFALTTACKGGELNAVQFILQNFGPFTNEALSAAKETARRRGHQHIADALSPVNQNLD
jgi:hypothetical protein